MRIRWADSVLQAIPVTVKILLVACCKSRSKGFIGQFQVWHALCPSRTCHETRTLLQFSYIPTPPQCNWRAGSTCWSAEIFIFHLVHRKARRGRNLAQIRSRPTTGCFAFGRIFWAVHTRTPPLRIWPYRLVTQVRARLRSFCSFQAFCSLQANVVQACCTASSCSPYIQFPKHRGCRRCSLVRVRLMWWLWCSGMKIMSQNEIWNGLFSVASSW
jgi:hypothetical protein